MAEQFISVGKLGKPHGIGGAFRFLLHLVLKNQNRVPKHFMIKTGGSYLPRFVRKIEWQGLSEGFISFEEIKTPEGARQYTNCELFMAEKDVHKHFAKATENMDFLNGYKASEAALGEIGIVREIVQHPGQMLCIVIKDGKEIMIPLVEEFISKINRKKKEIVFDLPEGLVDL